MENIKIRNFCQISSFEENITNYMIFIGPQASGKSTISKLIYFFKTIKREILSHSIQYLIREQNENDFKEKFILGMSHRFKQLFENVASQDFQIVYEYWDECSLTVQPSTQESELTITFSQNLERSINKIQELIHESIEFINQHNTKFRNSQAGVDSVNYFFDQLMHYDLRYLTAPQQTLFIPAGRSVTSMLYLSPSLFIQSNPSVDLLRESDTRLSYLLKQWFNEIDSIRQRKKKPVKEESNFGPKESLWVSETAEKILKGRFEIEDNIEKILVSDDVKIPLTSASSGQQEAVWILESLRFRGERNEFLVIEEPEAHLFPEAQKEIIELLAKSGNNNNIQLAITTHSPYVLSSLNNLLYAYQVGQKKPKLVEKIVTKDHWLDPSCVSVFYLDPDDPNFYYSIMDDNLHLIKVEEIDKITMSLNDVFDKLEDIEFNDES